MEKSANRFIWHYVKIFKWALLMLTACVIVRQVANTIEPYFLAKIYNTVIEKQGSDNYWNEVIFYAGIMAIITLSATLISEASMFIVARFVPKIKTIVIKDVFEDVNKQSISFFTNEMTGNISHKVGLLANNTTDFLNACFEVLHMVTRVFATIAVLTWVSWYYTLFVIIWIAIVVLISCKLGEIRRNCSRESGKMSSAANAVIVDSISNYSEIKSFANFKFEKINLLKSLRQLRRAETREKKIMGWIRIAQQLVSILSLVAFVFFSIFMLKIGKTDTTQFIYVNTVFLNSSYLAFQMSWIYNNISKMYGNVVSALDTLAVDPEIVDKKDAKVLKTKKANIRIKDVTFGYQNRNKLFKCLNVDIKAGEKVGLVGLSGSGKSSFVKLISRYYDIDSGSIMINGIDIRDITQESLHKHIATIPQDVCLFNRTLLENIRYGNVDASDRQVEVAAKKAFADIFIKKFKDGYKTKVGDRGIILSGGERQRIAIARAILKNAPILIFDEATSALDSQSETHIQQSLKNLMKGKTVLAIAHRLSTLREMDRILVFDKGKIVEKGNHDELLQKNGLYAKLYKMQVDGFMGNQI